MILVDFLGAMNQAKCYSAIAWYSIGVQPHYAWLGNRDALKQNRSRPIHLPQIKIQKIVFAKKSFSKFNLGNAKTKQNNDLVI